MSPPGRAKGKFRRAQHLICLMSLSRGRPKAGSPSFGGKARSARGGA